MTVVVKVGGAKAVDPAGALADVAALTAEGEDVVVVHGGSTAVDDALEAMGIDPEYVETPGGVVGRFTDEETMDVFKMAMPGLVNTDLVVGLQNQGVDAVGLSGVDGGLLTGPRKSAVRVVEDGKKKIKRGDHSGTIESVNAELLETLLEAGHTPTVSVPMLGVEDDGSYTAVNSDADRSAAAVAGALDADLVLLTDTTGVYRDPEDPGTRIERVSTPAEYDELTDAAEGFMKRKVMAAEEALRGGAPTVVVGDANAANPIRSALDGDGTTIERDALPES
ncbi:acetylglutamate/acetylaminoadipate kinase [Halarchaeum sp. CBA1220]|uniref:acetylglutamate/acetylaminoadipate kinase n=1 Tax=Halarchaeum sp. CBA1220 TaxID=1853682 RepID=UPI000F3A970A|nr:acetylglutamate/acetylaminoadipate kinase [Halarchaeum sp. CBA1220]QLC33668.1 acetylglutamate/acetylaminoadipate kinase [Halarchaeum sp. CBA1220]